LTSLAGPVGHLPRAGVGPEGGGVFGGRAGETNGRTYPSPPLRAFAVARPAPRPRPRQPLSVSPPTRHYLPPPPQPPPTKKSQQKKPTTTTTDDLQRHYDAVFTYLEVSSRVEVLDARLGVLQEILDLVRAQQAHTHTSHLEVIIIVLILVEVVLGLMQLLGLFRVIG
jgi:hypothetical protein